MAYGVIDSFLLLLFRPEVAQVRLLPGSEGGGGGEFVHVGEVRGDGEPRSGGPEADGATL